MKRQIRRKVFETNSSSMHSITVRGEDRFTSKLPTEEDGKVHIKFRHFGKAYENLDTPIKKIQYIVLDQPQAIDMLREVVLEYTGLEIELVEGDDEFFPLGGIDHNSEDVTEEYLEDKEILKDFIFNDKYIIMIDDDKYDPIYREV